MIFNTLREERSCFIELAHSSHCSRITYPFIDLSRVVIHYLFQSIVSARNFDSLPDGCTSGAGKARELGEELIWGVSTSVPIDGTGTYPSSLRWILVKTILSLSCDVQNY